MHILRTQENVTGVTSLKLCHHCRRICHHIMVNCVCRSLQEMCERYREMTVWCAGTVCLVICKSVSAAVIQMVTSKLLVKHLDHVILQHNI